VDRAEVPEPEVKVIFIFDRDEVEFGLILLTDE